MKKILLVLTFFVMSGNWSYAGEKVRVYTDYNPVRILSLVRGNDFDLEASKAGLSGSFKEIDASEVPDDRSSRDSWKMKSGKIVEDPSLKAELEKKQENKGKSVEKLKALGLNDEDLDNLGLKRPKGE